jgi:putative acetyltransferase
LAEIRREETGDRDAVYEVNLRAFGRETEPRLVESLRSSPSLILELSQVALEDGGVVGHVLFSALTIQAAQGDVQALALAPLAVLPAYQNRGIGSRLVEEGLAECRRLGHGIVIVIGHPAYYPRFGFVPARPLGLEVPFPVPDEAFMVLELTPGALRGVAGMVRYPPPFDEV